MRLIGVLLLLITNFACGSEHINNRSAYVEPEIAPYYRLFEKDIGRSPWTIAAYFYEEKIDNWVGYCQTEKHDRDPPRIYLDRKYWDKADDYDREQIVYHELGHCLLKRGHVETFCDERPCSIMYPSMIRRWLYKKFRDEYIEELKYGPYNAE